MNIAGNQKEPLSFLLPTQHLLIDLILCVDIDSTPEKPVFNLTVNLKDTWAKMEKKGK